MLNFLLFAVAVAVIIIAVPVAIGYWRKLGIASTVVVNRQTDDGESITVQANILTSFSEERKQEEIQKLMAHGDQRKEFTDARFKARIAEEIAAQNQSKRLNSV